ncbi:MAG: acetylglutamate kinase [Flavobacteriaceae bacterium]|nr:acetylglutamate kinase [Flavobacteriaceae bacterium]
MNQSLSIVKIGGHILDDPIAKKDFLSDFSKLEGLKILVHGGGRSASALAEQMQLNVQMVNGRRITDAKTLEVITMVYSGKINTSIVAELQGLNCNAVGCSGADANSIQSDKRPVSDIDFGFVGDIQAVNSSYISLLLHADLVPVFSAITHDNKGQLLNTNADTIAATLAIALASEFEVTLYYCFEKQGVLEDKDIPSSLITSIDQSRYQDLLTQGIISDGMLPKLKNCFDALEGQVSKVCIGQPSMLSSHSTNYTTLTL